MPVLSQRRGPHMRGTTLTACAVFLAFGQVGLAETALLVQRRGAWDTMEDWTTIKPNPSITATAPITEIRKEHFRLFVRTDRPSPHAYQFERETHNSDQCRGRFLINTPIHVRTESICVWTDKNYSEKGSVWSTIIDTVKLNEDRIVQHRVSSSSQNGRWTGTVTIDVVDWRILLKNVLAPKFAQH